MTLQDGVLDGAADPPQLAQPPCAAQDGSWCQLVYDLTSTGWLARSANPLVDGVGSTVMILAVAFVLRLLIHRAINRLTRPLSEGRVPSWLRAVRERGVRERGGKPPATAADSAPLSTERRSQRARTIGSLLRSVSSFVIYGVAFVMVLAEFGIDIAPILASAGVLGIAIGFGAQNLVRDFLSGIFMM
ncbi:MAG: mechanosensitive ion channel family protein, partial [Pseudonocardiaceae bacterium]